MLPNHVPAFVHGQNLYNVDEDKFTGALQDIGDTFTFHSKSGLT